MRILLVNKFYYPRGGDCTALMATERLLNAKRHVVTVFSMQHPRNLPTTWSYRFPKEVFFSNPGIGNKMRAIIRPFRSPEVVKQFTRVVKSFGPDVVHLHNIHSYLSPVVAQIAHKYGARVVWTMHDYKLICPSYSCLRDGKPCEECFTDKSNVFKHRCMKNSRIASLAAWMEALYWNKEKLERVTDLFIASSHFLKAKMVSAGFRAEQIEVLPNFVYQSMPKVVSKSDYYCYFGRMSEEKGVVSLLEAAKTLPYPLKVLGSGPLLQSLYRKYESANIHFIGRRPFEEIIPIVQRARFSVIPSIWYENSPHSLIESLCMGTPVLGANIGGIPELIDPGRNGELFTPGDVTELQSKITTCFQRYSDTYDFQGIATAAQDQFSSEKFYKKIISLYGSPYGS